MVKFYPDIMYTINKLIIYKRYLEADNKENIKYDWISFHAFRVQTNCRPTLCVNQILFHGQMIYCQFTNYYEVFMHVNNAAAWESQW